MTKNRLTRIVTKTGDKGQTSLGDGGRVPKDSAIIEALGTIDELNASLGLVSSTLDNIALQQKIITIQHRLFDIGGELCMPNTVILDESQVLTLEHDIVLWNKQLAPLQEFILPGADMPSAKAHLARTICRRAERRLVNLTGFEKINPWTLTYLNRLSDYLFMLARIIADDNHAKEIYWQHT